jgi:hypothetical protein
MSAMSFGSSWGNFGYAIIRGSGLPDLTDGQRPSAPAHREARGALARYIQVIETERHCELAKKTLSAFGPRLSQTCGAMPQMMVAFEFHVPVANTGHSGDGQADYGKAGASRISEQSRDRRGGYNCAGRTRDEKR